MIFSRPKTPDGRNPESIFQQRVADAPQGLQSITVQGQRTSRTTRGTYSIPEAPPASGAGSAVKGPYRLTAMQGDYLICRKDDSVPDGPFVYIAFADDDTGSGFSTQFAPKGVAGADPPKEDPSKYFIGVKTSATAIDDVNEGTFDGLWKAWTPVYIAKEESIRDSTDADARWTYEYSPEGTEMLRVRSVYQRPVGEGDPTLIEVQMVSPLWSLNEAVYAVTAKTEIGTLETDDVPSKDVKLLLYARPAMWARVWAT